MKNKMKYFSLSILVMAVAILTGCEKEPVTNGNIKIYTTTVKMAGSHNKALTENGVKTFAVDEQIAVIYKNIYGTTVKAVSAPLTAGDIIGNGKVATFSVEITDPDKSEVVSYIYPAAMANDDGTPNYAALSSQDGTLATLASNLDFCQKESDWNVDGSLPTNIQLDNMLSICKFTINDFTSNVTKLTIKNGSNIYTVTPTSSLSEIWVALKPIANGDITVYAARGKDLYTKTVTEKTLAANNLYPINVTTTRVEGAISGLFRIGDDLVYFSKGNLQATYDGNSWNWAFAANQYNYIGNAPGNTLITSSSPWISDNGTVDLFGWSTSNTYYGINNSDNGYQYEGSFEDWSSNVSGSWHTPAKSEMIEIFNNHTHGKTTVMSVPGLVILPYRTSVTSIELSYDASAWATMEANGAVFLPFAGYRIGTGVSYFSSGSGHYWTSTPNNVTSAHGFYSDGGNVEYGSGGREVGCSVRLIGTDN